MNKLKNDKKIKNKIKQNKQNKQKDIRKYIEMKDRNKT